MASTKEIQQEIAQVALFDVHKGPDRLARPNSLGFCVTVLDLLCHLQPKYKQTFKQCRERVIAQAKRTAEGDSQKILAALNEGINTVTELSDSLAIPPVIVYRCLNQMIDDGLVVKTRKPAEKHTLGGDRKTFFYWVKAE